MSSFTPELLLLQSCTHIIHLCVVRCIHCVPLTTNHRHTAALCRRCCTLSLAVLHSHLSCLMFSHVFVYRILKSTLNEGHHVIGNAVGIYYFNNTCLITLYILHIIWFHFILKMCYRFVVDGQVMWTVLHAWSCASMRGAPL